MHSFAKRGLAAAMCAGMVISLVSGCGKKDDSAAEAAVAVKVNEQTVDENVAKFIVRYEQAKFESTSGQFLQMFGYTDYWLMDMYGTGQPYSDLFKENQEQNIQRMLLASEAAADLGIALTDEQKSGIAEAAKAFIDGNDQEVLDKMGATQETVEQALTLYAVQKLVEDTWAADIDTEVSDEEAAQRKVRYTAFVAQTETEEAAEAVTEGEDLEEESITEGEAAVEAESDVLTGSAGETEEEAAEAATEGAEDATEAETETEDPAMAAAREAAKARAEEFLASAKDVEDAEAFTAAGNETKGDDNSVLVNTFTFGDNSTYPDAVIIEATKGLEDGTLVDHVVEAGDMYYVLYVEDAFDEEATAQEKESILETRRSDKIEESYTTLTEGAEIAIDGSVFGNMVWDYYLTNAPEEAETEEISESASEGENVGE